jgi:hypothetical protein
MPIGILLEREALYCLSLGLGLELYKPLKLLYLTYFANTSFSVLEFLKAFKLTFP